MESAYQFKTLCEKTDFELRNIEIEIIKEEYPNSENIMDNVDNLNNIDIDNNLKTTSNESLPGSDLSTESIVLIKHLPINTIIDTVFVPEPATLSSELITENDFSNESTIEEYIAEEW